MKKFKIVSFDDPKFFKLGLICLNWGLLIYWASFLFDFSGLIALKAGGGLGLLICLTFMIAKYFKKSQG